MQMPNYLEKLLDGVEVEWKRLGDIAEIYGGLTGKSKADFDNGNAKYISYKNIFNNIDVNPNQLELVKVSKGERQHEVRYGDVLFTGSSEIADEAGISSAVTVDFKEPVYLNSFSFGLRFYDNIKLIPEFSKYLFRSKFMRREIAKSASGVTRFNISKARFKKILVPIPCPNNPEKSLQIQRDIVRILDTFTELTAELTAELNLRKQQYQYYRDKLLTFNEGERHPFVEKLLDGVEVEWLPLAKLGQLVRGSGLPKTDFTESGVPAIHYGQIYTYYGISTETTISFVSAETAQKLKKVNTGDVIITNTSENLEDVGKALVYLGKSPAVTGGHATIFKPNDLLVGKYLAYFTQTSEFFREKRKLAKGTKVIDVSATDMSKIPIPIPCPDNPEKSLQIQREIVRILDKFDTLVNSLTEGLPREIELRQKQYEYYRDLLLSFPKPDAEAAA